MKTRTRLWVAPGLVFLLFLITAWIADRALDPEGGPAWALWTGLIVLGLTTAFVVFRFLSKRWRGRIRREEQAAKEDRIAHAFLTADEQLAGSKGGKAGVQGLPLVLLLGPPGSAKTTVLLQSSLGPDLLAGEAQRDDQVVPTEAVNLWFGQGTVFADASGKLVGDDGRWAALLEHVRPRRLASALRGGEHPPRLAVVCVGCDEFIKPGASESLPKLASTLRSRLVEAAAALGIELPVYVLLTRADRLPYFDDFVGQLRDGEADQVLGATLPAQGRPSGASYAESQARRVGEAVAGIFRNMALKRTELLRRESAPATQAGVYEFPRELTKISDLLASFLIEVCRPSQLKASPFLRGFYVTGVRAIEVGDRAVAAPAPAMRAPSAGRATMVFDPARLKQQPPPPPTGGPTRRVPHWAFLRRLFGDVVLADRTARALTRGSSRIDVVRRALLTSLALVSVLLSTGFTVSYLLNRAVARDVREALATSVDVGRSGAPIPPLDDVRRLDALRVQVARLDSLERGRVPLRMRWGLYRGRRLHERAREAFLTGFDRLIGGPARLDLAAHLAGLPEVPTEAAEYGRTYDALKTYLIVTSHPEHSSAAFVRPNLTRHWLAAQGLDPERDQGVRTLIDFFADQIALGHPNAPRPDDILVTRTRDFLSRFAQTDRFYQSMLAEAGANASAVSFDAEFPDAPPLVSNDYVVPAAFTRTGWDFVQAGLQDVDRLFRQEDWVVGAQAVSPGDRAVLAQEVGQRYTRDYVVHWQNFLASGSVQRFQGARDAAGKLSRLSGNQSPLMQMLALASRHTGVDTARIGPAFQPLHAVFPPGETDRLVGEWNQDYVRGLEDLYFALDQVAGTSGGARAAAMPQAERASSDARQALRSMTRGFATSGNALTTGDAIMALLDAPIRGAESLINTLPLAELNGAGATFCSQFNGLLNGYPFQRSGGDAAVDDVVAALKPNESVLWTFYQSTLSGLLVPQGPRYFRAPGADPAARREFVDFFNRAADASRALFDATGNGPRVVFALRPTTTETLPEITVTVDGQSHTFTQRQPAWHQFEWDGQRARNVRITALVNGRQLVLLAPPPGPWALFHAFEVATWRAEGGDNYTVTWQVPGPQSRLSAQLSLSSRIPIFDPSFIQRLSCVSRVVG